jgi:hypothetical protein
MLVSDETTKIYRATACVESRSVNYVELLLVGAAVVKEMGNRTDRRPRKRSWG